MTTEERKRIRRVVRQTCSFVKAGKILGYSATKLRSLYEKYNWRQPRGLETGTILRRKFPKIAVEPKQTTEERYAHVREVVRQTCSFAKAAEITGYSEGTLRTIYRRKGWLTPHSYTTKIDLCLAKQMRGEGKMVREIAEIFGTSPSYLSRLMHNQELECKRNGPTARAKQYYEALKEGKTYEEIGGVFGVTRQAVDEMLRKWYGNDISKRYGRPKTKSYNIVAMVELRRCGWTLAQIADLFEITDSYASYLLKKIWGESVKTQRKPQRKWDIYEAWSLFEEGWTLKRLAAAYGIHTMSIARGLAQARKAL